MASDAPQRIVEGALEALRTKGFQGASARTIAALAGVNPGLIFYYFPTLDDLLLAALRETSEERLERHRPAAEAVRTPAELVALLRHIYEEDSASGRCGSSRRWSPAAWRGPSSAAGSWRSWSPG